MSDKRPPNDEDLVAHMADPGRAGLEARLAADPDARARLETWREQDAMLRALLDPVADEPVPERLVAALRMSPAGRGRPGAVAVRGAGALGPVGTALAAALVLALGAAGGWTAARMAAPPGTYPPQIAEAALAAHQTFAVEVAHPVEVPASQSEHLTGWLSKRLGHPIQAPDFAAEGFRLMGGRILPSGTGTAALFMYEDDLGRRVTLYVAPDKGAPDTAFRFAEEGAEQSFYWIDGDLSYAVTGALPRDRLRAMAVAAYDQLI